MTNPIRSIVVFCGSSLGENRNFEIQAALLGHALAKRNIRLIYGGAKVGLMGAVADGALKAGGHVIGVLPTFLQTKEIAHDNLTELILVSSMHERKLKMNDLCDGVIALPGGYGTLEELFEMLTWSQLGLHGKPIGILNVNGFYNNLQSQIDVMLQSGFLKLMHKDMLLMHDDIDSLLNAMISYEAPEGGKWITKRST